MSCVVTYICGAVSYAVSTAQSVMGALLPAAAEAKTEAKMEHSSETDSATESESESECTVTIEVVDVTKTAMDVDCEVETQTKAENKTLPIVIATAEDDNLTVHDAASEADALRSLLIEAEDRADMWAQQLSRAEKRIAKLQTENEEVTSAFYAATDVADARDRKIKQLEAELTRMKTRDMITRKLCTAKATIDGHVIKISTLERHVEALEADSNEKRREMAQCHGLTRQAQKERMLAEVKLGGKLAAVRRDLVERAEVRRLVQCARELKHQLLMKAPASAAIAPATGTTAGLWALKEMDTASRRVAAVSPFASPLQYTEASARLNTPLTAVPVARTRSTESEAAQRPQRKRNQVSTESTVRQAARTQTKTRAQRERTSVTTGAVATRTGGKIATAAAAAKPAWR